MLRFASLLRTLLPGAGNLAGACLIFAATSNIVFAQHLADVRVFSEDGKLATSRDVYEDAFDWFGGVLFTESPGFQSSTGAFAEGDQLSFNVVDRLWYFDGTGLADPPQSAAVEISNGPSLAIVAPQTEFEPGFVLANVGPSGAIHTHPAYTLSGTSDVGVYGLVLELTSPQYEKSAPFVIALGHFGETLTLDQYRAGVAAIAEAALQPVLSLPGDANGDGKVDFADFIILKSSFGTAAGGPADFNGDGKVNFGDFTILKANFGRTAAAAVPEPAGWLLAVPALAGLLLFVRRRRK